MARDVYHGKCKLCGREANIVADPTTTPPQVFAAEQSHIGINFVAPDQPLPASAPPTLESPADFIKFDCNICVARGVFRITLNEN